MSVLLISGSLLESSPAGVALHYIWGVLDGLGEPAEGASLRQLPYRNSRSAAEWRKAVAQLHHQIERSRAVILAAPAHNGALEAALAALMDALPNHAFQGKVVLPIVTGNEPRDRLAADAELRPMLRSKGAKNLLASVHVQDDETSCNEDGTIQIAPPLEERLIGATGDLFTPRRPKASRPAQTLARQSFERDPDHAA